jgi:hypothetical protein
MGPTKVMLRTKAKGAWHRSSDRDLPELWARRVSAGQLHALEMVPRSLKIKAFEVPDHLMAAGTFGWRSWTSCES